MPIYLFQNPLNGEVLEVEQSMNEEHKYIDQSGLEWKRVFSKPTMRVAGKKLDFRSQKDIDTYQSVYKKRYDHNVKKGKIDPKSGKEL